VLEAEVSLSKETELGFAARATAARQSVAVVCVGPVVDKSCTEARTRSREIEAAIARGAYWTAERLLEAGK